MAQMGPTVGTSSSNKTSSTLTNIANAATAILPKALGQSSIFSSNMAGSLASFFSQNQGSNLANLAKLNLPGLSNSSVDKITNKILEGAVKSGVEYAIKTAPERAEQAAVAKEKAQVEQLKAEEDRVEREIKNDQLMLSKLEADQRSQRNLESARDLIFGTKSHKKEEA